MKTPTDRAIAEALPEPCPTCGRLLCRPGCTNATFPAPRRYTVERHGDGWAIYLGRDHQHHGLNLGHLTECSEGLAAHIAEGLNLVFEASRAPAPEDAAELVEAADEYRSLAPLDPDCTRDANFQAASKRLDRAIDAAGGWGRDG